MVSYNGTKLLFFIILIFHQSSYQQINFNNRICGWVGDNYFNVQMFLTSNGTKSVKLKTGMCSSTGWSAIGFSKQNTIVNASYVLVAWNDPKTSIFCILILDLYSSDGVVASESNTHTQVLFS